MADQLKYTRLSDSTVSVTGYLNNPIGELEIPEKMKHAGITYDIIAIGTSTFSGCSDIQSLILNKIETIGAKAFAGCEMLQFIQLSQNLEEIKEYAFAWCNLNTLLLPPDLQYIGEYAFVGCTALDRVICTSSTPAQISEKAFDSETYKKGTLYVQPEAIDIYKSANGWKKFKNIDSVDELKQPMAEGKEEDNEKNLIFRDDLIYRITDGANVCVEQCNPDITNVLSIPSYIDHDGKRFVVNAIEKNAFENNDRLKQIKISESIEDIPLATFARCHKLTDIIVDPRNQRYTDIDGVLTDKYKNILLCYPKGRQTAHYRVPASTFAIAPASFIDCPYLKSICMYDNIHQIGTQAFYNCTSLHSVSLPLSLAEVGGGAFYQCEKLESIYSISEEPSQLNDSFDTNIFNQATLFVPRDYLNNYKNNEEWRKFNKIKLITDYCESPITYRINGEETATVIAVDSTYTGKLAVAEKICQNGIYYTVNKIGRESFLRCSKLTSVALPDSIVSIGYRAFFECIHLKSFSLSKELRMIENEALSQCSNLSSITITEKVEAIGDSIFDGCSKLQEIQVDPSNPQYISQEGILYDRRGALVSYPAGKKENTLKLAASVDAMNSSTFMDAMHLTNFDVATNNKEYTDIDGVLISRNYKRLIAYPRGRQDAQYTVYGSINSICRWAFSNSHLKEIILPQSLTELESGAFYFCQELERIEIPNGITEISDRCFLSCTSLREVILPQSIDKIGMGAFSNCVALERINLSDQISHIDHGTFANCSSLTHIELPTNLESIGNYAFANCPQITSLTMPASVNSIGRKAFSGSFVELGMLTKLLDEGGEMKIEMQGETPPVIFEDTFDNYCYQKVLLIVPDNSVSIYRSTDGWEKFKNIRGKGAFKNKKNVSLPSFDLDGFTFSITGDDTVSLTKCKRCLYPNNKITLPKTVRHNGKEFKIASIGESAFEETDIYELNIEADIESIEKFAFANSDLTSIRLPKTLQEIGMGAFGGCEFLHQVCIPSSVKEIGIEAFAECRNLITVNIPNGIDKINYHLFYNCQRMLAICLPNSIEVIEEGAFANCGQLQCISFGDQLTEIGKLAFEGCASLKVLSLPDTVNMIDDKAFHKCDSLTHAELPSSLSYFGNQVFLKCNSLQSIYIENCDAYTSQEGVLYNGDKSELIVHPASLAHANDTFFVPNSVKTIANYAFESVHTGKIILSEKTTTIGDYSFSYSKLKEIVVPGKVKSIGEHAFSNCKNLKSITLPEKVNHIKTGTFRSCSKLETIGIEGNVKLVETAAFKGCSALQSICVNGDNCVLESKAFESCKMLSSITISGIKKVEPDTFYKCENIKDYEFGENVSESVKNILRNRPN